MIRKLLLLSALLLTIVVNAQVTAYPVSDLLFCSNSGSPVQVDLTVQDSVVLGDQRGPDFSVHYFTTRESAEAGSPSIDTPQSYTAVANSRIFVRVNNIATEEYAIAAFYILINSGPQLPEFTDVTSCGTYILPPLPTLALYYTAAGGTGSILAPGTALSVSTTIYVYAANEACTSEANFRVTIMSEPRWESDPYVACENNGMGYGVIDLTTIVAEVEAVYPAAENIAFFYTRFDAESDSSPIADLPQHVIATPFTETLYMAFTVGTCRGVSPIQLVVQNCDNTNTLSGKVTFDADGDGCGENDYGLGGIKIKYNLGNDILTTFTNADGSYTFYNVPEGDVTLWAENIVTGQFDFGEPVTLTLAAGATEYDFCATSSAPYTDVSAYIFESVPARPGFTADYNVVVTNVGTLPASGTITVTYNTQYATNPVFERNAAENNTISWTYENLRPQQTLYKYFSIDIAQPPVVVSGTEIPFMVAVTTNAEDANTNDNTFTFNQVAVNSYDPNDIAVREGEQITPVQADGFLHYRVRFQNTGTANAERVRINLQLDEKFDSNSFEPLASGHSYRVEQKGSNVNFIFDDIDLPYEDADAEGSNGYITYRVRALAGIDIGDSVQAKADIYFDFNEAIITNTVTTTVVSTAGLNGVANGALLLYPNPAAGNVHLALNREFSENAHITVTGVRGEKLIETAMYGTEHTLDISTLKAGVYFITVGSGAGNYATKLIVK